jgi:Icc-related predicted phosphoesterase
MTTRDKVRVAAVGDIHCGKAAAGALHPLLEQVAEHADVFVICGDLTDHGLPEEAQVLVKELSAVKVPIAAILGNHDYQSGKVEEVERIIEGAGVHLLTRDACEIHGVGFAGVKGFGGGFGRRILEPFGEETVKRFVYDAVEEALKLEAALGRLRAAQLVAVLHYAPIQATVEGEPPEIFAFLGCSRLEEPLNRYGVAAAFHGHAHHGRPEGRTSTGVPVYNVALPLLRHAFPDRPPFRVVEIPVQPAAPEEKPAPARAGRKAAGETAA